MDSENAIRTEKRMIDKNDEIYPLTVVKDRYNGTYTGGKYLAWNKEPNEVPRVFQGECDADIVSIADMLKNLYGKGNTPEEAIDDLAEKMEKFGGILFNED